MPLRRLLYALPILLLVLFGWLAWRGLAPDRNPSALPSALIGHPAPAFSLPGLDGLHADGRPVPGLSRDDLKGKVTVVNVWASWCAPCRQEHPLLMELAKDPAIRLVGINYKDNPETARRFLGTLGNPFAAVGVDQHGRTAIDWGVYGVPETFIVGPDATIRYKQIGPLTPEGLQEFRSHLGPAS